MGWCSIHASMSILCCYNTSSVCERKHSRLVPYPREHGSFRVLCHTTSLSGCCVTQHHSQGAVLHNINRAEPDLPFLGTSPCFYGCCFRGGFWLRPPTSSAASRCPWLLIALRGGRRNRGAAHEYRVNRHTWTGRYGGNQVSTRDVWVQLWLRR